jgi:hypothetical protein
MKLKWRGFKRSRKWGVSLSRSKLKRCRETKSRWMLRILSAGYISDVHCRIAPSSPGNCVSHVMSAFISPCDCRESNYWSSCWELKHLNNLGTLKSGNGCGSGVGLPKFACVVFARTEAVFRSLVELRMRIWMWSSDWKMKDGKFKPFRIIWLSSVANSDSPTVRCASAHLRLGLHDQDWCDISRVWHARFHEWPRSRPMSGIVAGEKTLSLRLWCVVMSHSTDLKESDDPPNPFIRSTYTFARFTLVHLLQALSRRQATPRFSDNRLGERTRGCVVRLTSLKTYGRRRIRHQRPTSGRGNEAVVQHKAANPHARPRPDCPRSKFSVKMAVGLSFVNAASWKLGDKARLSIFRSLICIRWDLKESRTCNSRWEYDVLLRFWTNSLAIQAHDASRMNRHRAIADHLYRLDLNPPRNGNELKNWHLQIVYWEKVWKKQHKDKTTTFITFHDAHQVKIFDERNISMLTVCSQFTQSVGLILWIRSVSQIQQAHQYIGLGSMTIGGDNDQFSFIKSF